MKKTLLATAILGAMSFAAVAQAAPTVYGNIQLAVDAGQKLTAFDNGSTIGFKGEEAMDSGLTAFYKAEFEFNAGATKADSGINKGDQAYLGLKGSFGEVKVGSFDTLTDNFVGDVISDGDYIGADSGFNGNSREHQQLAYIGNFDGVKLGLSVTLNSANGTTTTKTGSVDFTKGVYAAATPTSKQKQAMQAAVAVPVGDMTVSAAFDTQEGDFGLGLTAPVGDLSVGAKFETKNATTAGAKDETILAASVKMNYGMGSAYAIASSMTEASKSSFGLGANYNLTKSLYVFGEVGTENMDATVIGAALVF